MVDWSYFCQEIKVEVQHAVRYFFAPFWQAIKMVFLTLLLVCMATEAYFTLEGAILYFFKQAIR